MRGLIKLGVAVAAGYSFGRLIECKAQGVPVAFAFRTDNILKPVATIKLLAQAGGVVPQALDVRPA